MIDFIPQPLADQKVTKTAFPKNNCRWWNVIDDTNARIKVYNDIGYHIKYVDADQLQQIELV